MLSALLLAASAVAPFGSLNHQTLPASTNDFWFVALGDNRPAGAGLPPNRTFRELLEEVGIIGPKFIISSGDLLYGNEDTMDQFKQEIAWARPLLEALPCPFYNAPGNHEINNRADLLDAYTAAFGEPYGTFNYGGYKFVGVCTEFPAPKASIFGAQLDWLKSTLADKSPAIVFQHHPVFARETNAEEGATIEGAASVHEMYRDGGVKMVVEGHDHIYNAQVHDGVDYRIAGGAGAPLDGQPGEGGYFHFMLVHAHDGKLEATPIPLGTLEITPISDGVVAASDYADTDLPVTNLKIESKFLPHSVTADYTTKAGKPKAVDVKISGMEKVRGKYVTRVSLTLVKHRATFVRLAE